MTTEKVYSLIEDKNIKNNLNRSSIWKNCHHETDIKPKGRIICYTIKFDGLKPIQVLKVETVEIN